MNSKRGTRAITPAFVSSLKYSTNKEHLQYTCVPHTLTRTFEFQTSKCLPIIRSQYFFLSNSVYERPTNNSLVWLVRIPKLLSKLLSNEMNWKLWGQSTLNKDWTIKWAPKIILLRWFWKFIEYLILKLHTSIIAFKKKYLKYFFINYEVIDFIITFFN